MPESAATARRSGPRHRGGWGCRARGCGGVGKGASGPFFVRRIASETRLRSPPHPDHVWPASPAMPAGGCSDRAHPEPPGPGVVAGRGCGAATHPRRAAAAPALLCSREEKRGITRSTKSSRERLVRAGVQPVVAAVAEFVDTERCVGFELLGHLVGRAEHHRFAHSMIGVAAARPNLLFQDLREAVDDVPPRSRTAPRNAFRGACSRPRWHRCRSRARPPRPCAAPSSAGAPHRGCRRVRRQACPRGWRPHRSACRAGVDMMFMPFLIAKSKLAGVARREP